MTTDYSMTVFGMSVHGKSPFIYVFFPVFITAAYLASCISLYAFAHMVDAIEFSWIAGMYWMIIIGTVHWVFCGGTGSGST